MKAKRLCIFGCGGHGKVVLEIAQLSGLYDRIVFFDDKPALKTVLGTSVIGTYEDFIKQDSEDNDFFIAVGNCNARCELTQRLRQDQREVMPTLVHPMATVSPTAKIGKDSVVMAGAVINTSSVIGEGCIINTNAVVEHDCIVGPWSHISVSAALCGTVHLGTLCFVGAGATIINNITVCDSCTIGAGATVVRDITEKGTYIGIPANRLGEEMDKISRKSLGGGINT